MENIGAISPANPDDFQTVNPKYTEILANFQILSSKNCWGKPINGGMR